MSNYVYTDEDNEPMTESLSDALARAIRNKPEVFGGLFQNLDDRDCPNCKHKMPNGDCNAWNCKFEPKQYIVEEVQEWLVKTNSASSGTGAK